jgi:uncharacterized glyoxalase superfamily protein PhnB
METNFSILIFVNDLLEAFEHYKKAFNATLISLARGSENEPIHLEMDVLGNRQIALSPLSPEEIKKGNNVALCLKFTNEKDLMLAYDVLKDGGQAEELRSFPWSSLEGYVIDKYGVKWCIGI